MLMLARSHARSPPNVLLLLTSRVLDAWRYSGAIGAWIKNIGEGEQDAAEAEARS